LHTTFHASITNPIASLPEDVSCQMEKTVRTINNEVLKKAQKSTEIS
jgi:hypothetical protein